MFKKAQNTQAFLKMGIMGFAGAGKTYTGSKVAIGLVNLCKANKLGYADKPVFFLDTETGSDWVAPMFDGEGIELFTAKTRSFDDLMAALDEAEKNASVLIIDSISHFWREITDTYLKEKKKRGKRGFLEFQDWGFLKQKWGLFTDAFVNSNLHIVMCGRAGFEYDFFEDGDKRDLVKTGVKMKAENETGYEPSILILMERHMDIDTKRVSRIAKIVKDRSSLMDGMEIPNPTFDSFQPHIQFLNLGGQQLGVDTSRTSVIPEDGKTKRERDEKRKLILLDKTKELLSKHYPGTTNEAKQAKAGLLEKHFGSRSWMEINEVFKLAKVEPAYKSLLQAIEPQESKDVPKQK